MSDIPDNLIQDDPKQDDPKQDEVVATPQELEKKATFRDVAVKSGHGVVLQSVNDVWNFAVFAIHAGMVPESYRDKANQRIMPEKVTIALLKGLELGMKPMTALQRIYVVRNMPVIYGDAVIGHILSTGLLEDFHETVIGEKKEDMIATCTMKRKGIATALTKSFSWADAAALGLTSKTGSQYQIQPKTMLMYRARGLCSRSLFGDVLNGLYVEGETETIEAEIIEQPDRVEQFANHLQAHPLGGE